MSKPMEQGGEKSSNTLKGHLTPETNLPKGTASLWGSLLPGLGGGKVIFVQGGGGTFRSYLLFF